MRGVGVRLNIAVPESTRVVVASTALGVGLGFTIAYVVACGWVRADFYGGTVTAGPL